MHFAKRTAHYREILAEYVDYASVYRAVAGYNAVAEECCFFEPEVGAAVLNKFIDFHEAAGVKNCVDALACGHLTFVVLFGDGLFSAAKSRFFAFGNQSSAQFVDRFVRHYFLPPHNLSDGTPDCLPSAPCLGKTPSGFCPTCSAMV